MTSIPDVPSPTAKSAGEIVIRLYCVGVPTPGEVTEAMEAFANAKVKEAYEDGMLEGFEKAKAEVNKIAEEGVKREDCTSPGHDDRWCAHCSSMNDGMAILADRFEALPLPEGKEK